MCSLVDLDAFRVFKLMTTELSDGVRKSGRNIYMAADEHRIPEFSV